ncbi:hypothetical protein DY000_02005106 [Brassica cretica]|uniref:Uncharacterized protein n=1 Tax=Brassica cretica TaxID=69181 RepID=A0ABQ7BWD8_BRACR|nr:hypothetical protein DY000_02005106 [Brassica cretica]
MAKSFQAQTPYPDSVVFYRRTSKAKRVHAMFISYRKKVKKQSPDLYFPHMELNELKFIRSLFFERFGLQFDRHSVDLRPGNLVSSEIIKLFVKKMPQDAMSPETIVETNIAASVESVTEDSVSTDNLGFRDSDAVKIEIFKTWIGRKNIMKDSSKFLHLNLVVSRKQIDHCS